MPHFAKFSSLPSRIHCIWLLLAALCASPDGWSATPHYRALLVGVSEYPALRKGLQLAGPRNDVERMRQVLIGRGLAPQSITVLADGVGGAAALPTRAHILQALEQLAVTARPGDYIVLLLAGHGSQVPVPPNSPYEAAEPDGKFEVFLPRDVEGWGQRDGNGPSEVRNAIYDHEIRALVDRMTAAGAFVWGIFDACHAATLVRSGGDPDVRLRQVPPTDLGIPEGAMQHAEIRARSRPQALVARSAAAPAGAGASVFFYAAQTIEATPELMVPLDLPPGSPVQRRSQGLFTYTILRALEGGAGMSYQQLAQQVLARYGATDKARMVTPLFSGTALDSGVLGQSVAAVRQWNLLDGPELQLGAGLLADVREDSVLAILPTPVAKDSELIGYVRVAKASVALATLEPVAHAGQPARPLADLRAGRVARMVSPAVPMELTVAVDLGRCTTPCLFGAALQHLRRAAPARTSVPGAQIRWVEPGAGAALTLTAQDRTLWFAPPDVSLQACAAGPARARCAQIRERSLVSLKAGPGASAAGLATALARQLHAVSRAHNLMRLAGALAVTPATAQLQVALEFTPTGGTPAPVRAGQRLTPGTLRIALENPSFTAMDVSVFYLDSKYGITQVYPLEAGANNRLEPGARPQPFDVDITDETLGTERLLVIGVEARRHGERADYAFLASPAQSHAVVTRGTSDETAQLLRDAGFADYQARGVMPVSPPSSTGMQVFTWHVAE